MQRRNVVDRRSKIAQMIARDGSIRAQEVARLFNVSTETIRKDLLYLDRAGVAKKGHGGALAHRESIEHSVRISSTENIVLKNKIAEKALEYIQPGAIIGLDSGSTILCLARLLKIKNGLTVITNSLLVADELAESDNDVYLTGGALKGNLMAVAGMWALNAINSVRPNISFIGSSGVYSHGGPCSTSFDEVEIKKAFILNSSMSIVMMDSQKFYRNSLVKCVDWEQVSLLITDDGIPDDAKEEIFARTKIVIV